MSIWASINPPFVTPSGASRFNAAIRQAAAAMAVFTARMWASIHPNLCGPRCHYCHPFANPRPLRIDGHAYRRRTQRRAR